MSHYPKRMGEADCRDYLRTGRCKYGESCKYNHPPNVLSGGGIKTLLDPTEPPFPIRPNEPPCQYFLKHGTCKFGQTCKFNHPASSFASGTTSFSSAVIINVGGTHVFASPSGQGSGIQRIAFNPGASDTNTNSGDFQQQSPLLQVLPQRPGEPDCIYFLRNGRCKYGITCKYHHPVNAIGDQNIAGRVPMHTQIKNGRGRATSVESMADLGVQGQIQLPAQHNSGLGVYGQQQRLSNVSGVPMQILLPDGSVAIIIGNPTHSSASLHQSNTANFAGERLSRYFPPVSDITNYRESQQHLYEHSPSTAASASPVITSLASSFDTATSSFEFLLSQGQVHRQQMQSESSGELWRRNHSQPQLSSMAEDDESGVGTYYVHQSAEGPPPKAHLQNHFSPHGVNGSHLAFPRPTDEYPSRQHVTSSTRRLMEPPFIQPQTRNKFQEISHQAEFREEERSLMYSTLKSSDSNYVTEETSQEWSSNANLPPSYSMVVDQNWDDTTGRHSHGTQREELSTNHLSSSAPSNLSSLSKRDIYQEDLYRPHTRRSSTHVPGIIFGRHLHSGRDNHGKNVDDGLSMMTSALLTMLDTPDDPGAKRSSNGLDRELSLSKNTDQPSSFRSQLPSTAPSTPVDRHLGLGLFSHQSHLNRQVSYNSSQTISYKTDEVARSRSFTLSNDAQNLTPYG